MLKFKLRVRSKLSVLLADAEDSGNADVVHSEDPDGEDAVAAETQTPDQCLILM